MNVGGYWSLGRWGDGGRRKEDGAMKGLSDPVVRQTFCTLTVVSVSWCDITLQLCMLPQGKTEKNTEKVAFFFL